MKKILIGLGVLLVLLVVAVLVGPSFFNWNSYKGEITAKAREATGRDLTIDGDISLSILWTPTLSVKKVRFANIAGGSAPDMATLESLDVRLAFAPLDWIGGKFQVERIELVQPTIILERLADGRANWQFERSAAGATSGGGGGGGGPEIRLDDIRIANGTLIYRDGKSGSEQRIESLNAELGASSLLGPFRAGGSALARRNFSLDLVCLLADLGEHSVRIVPVEADHAGLGLQLERTGEGRKCGRDAGEGARRLLIAPPIGFLRAFLALDAFPQTLDSLRGETSHVAEHMGMTAHKLLADGLDHVAEIERALLLRHSGMEDHLQQQIAEFVAQVGEIAPHDGISHFIRLFDRVRGDGREVLFEVPRAAGVGRAQRRHDFEEAGDVAGRGHG